MWVLEEVSTTATAFKAADEEWWIQLATSYSYFMCRANKSKRITWFFCSFFLACLFALLWEIGKKRETWISGTAVRVRKMETRVGYTADEWGVIEKFGRKWKATEEESVEKRKKGRGGSMADWGEKARRETEGVTLFGCHSSLHSLVELCLWSALSPVAQFTGWAEKTHTPTGRNANIPHTH